MKPRVLILALVALAACDPNKRAAESASTASAQSAPLAASPTTPASGGVAATAAATTAVPTCTAPEIVFYLEAHKASCGRPCKADGDCPSGQACNITGLKVPDGVGTARDAVEICGSPKAVTASAAGATPRKPVSKTAREVDTSDWKNSPAGSTLEVLWTVDQTKAVPRVTNAANDDLTKHTVPLELTLTLNGHPHTVSLETNAAPPFSDACSRVSFFFAGINILFQLERADGGRAVVTRSRTSESAPDKSQQVLVFDLPADAKISQEIVTVDPTGKRVSKKCSAAKLP